MDAFSVPYTFRLDAKGRVSSRRPSALWLYARDGLRCPLLLSDDSTGRGLDAGGNCSVRKKSRR